MGLLGNLTGLFLVLQIRTPSLKREGTKKSPYNPQLQGAADQQLLILLRPHAQPGATGRVGLIYLPVWAGLGDGSHRAEQAGLRSGKHRAKLGLDLQRQLISEEHNSSLQAVGHLQSQGSP